MKTISNILFNLIIVFLWVGLTYGCYYAVLHRPCLGTMRPGFTVLAGLAIAFTYVNYINPTPFKSVKPFNCVTCLTGWFTLILAYLFNVDFYAIYFCIGILVGGLFERLKLRWL